MRNIFVDMNILIAISNSYIPYAAVMLQSLADSNPNLCFNVYIICPDVTAGNLEKLHKQFNNLITTGQIFIHCPQIPQQIQDEIKDISPYIIEKLNTSFILRLFAPRILPENIDQILYLDVDTVISSSLNELATMKLDEETALAAVKDLVRFDDYSRLGIDGNKHTYFNSGVMLLNMAYWRKHNIGDKCLQQLVKHSTLYKFPDQDALNVVCEGKTAYLHPKYNCLLFFYARKEFLKARVRTEEYDRVLEAIEQPAIIHYVFVNKPWYKGEELPKRELWLDALQKTEWKNTPLRYRNGTKGRFRQVLKDFANRALPFIGIPYQGSIFTKHRYKHIEILALAIYYGFAYWLPNFDSRFFGKISNTIRVWCVKNIFEHVGKGVNIGRKARFGNGRNIYIGTRSNIGAYCQVPSNIVIGDNVMMGPHNFFFGGFTHDISDHTKPMIDQGFKFLNGRTEIGDDVWIGRECLFMPCKKIGSHSVVGARSVVTKDVPEYVIVGGNPAKVIKERK